MRARNAEVLKLKMPPHQSYARQSADQAAIDKHLAEHGAKQAVNTGKVFSFNGRGNRSKGYGKQSKRIECSSST